jgi:hypothetical protein
VNLAQAPFQGPMVFHQYVYIIRNSNQDYGSRHVSVREKLQRVRHHGPGFLDFHRVKFIKHDYDNVVLSKQVKKSANNIRRNLVRVRPGVFVKNLPRRSIDGSAVFLVLEINFLEGTLPDGTIRILGHAVYCRSHNRTGSPELWNDHVGQGCLSDAALSIQDSMLAVLIDGVNDIKNLGLPSGK